MYNTHHIIKIFFITFIGCLSALRAFATPDQTQLAVWTNEAIVATYTYNYTNFIQRQKEIARYFTAEGWINYSKALIDSQLPDTVKKNSYDVSAVAAMPPTIKQLNAESWEASMPLLVIYKNSEYQQKQTLMITLRFIAAEGKGVRGLAISSLKAVVTEPPCPCEKKKPSAAIA